MPGHTYGTVSNLVVALEAIVWDPRRRRYVVCTVSTVTTSDLGTLTTRPPYAFCVYDTSAGSRLRLTIPIEGLCSGNLCWKETRTALKYASKAAPTALDLKNTRTERAVHIKGASRRAHVRRRGAANARQPSEPRPRRSRSSAYITSAAEARKNPLP